MNQRLHPKAPVYRAAADNSAPATCEVCGLDGPFLVTALHWRCVARLPDESFCQAANGERRESVRLS